MEEKDNKYSIPIPIAIVIAGVVVAGAVIYSGWSAGGAVPRSENSSFGNNLSPTAENIRPVDENDHIFGNKNALVSIVEYSDFECAFCKRFHPTLTRIIEEYPNEIKWVYRHFPLTSIHSHAFLAGMASECAAQLGGNDIFWQFTEELFDNQSRLGTDLYKELASTLGLPQVAFSECLESERHRDKVQADLRNAIDSGGRGTPFTIVINKDGEVFPFSGALPYEQVKTIIEKALASQ
ncbi:thioredoxin domain-containing protein [Patescibacteria group bacterium]|nr:thioredoxin domain-containing protein [Patescibacteria group bacterium]